MNLDLKTLLILSYTLVLGLVLLERVFPRHPYRWLKMGLFSDLGFQLLLVFLVPILHSVFPMSFQEIRSFAPDWLEDVSLPWQFVIALVVGDFLRFIVHFATHQSKLLWPVHLLHHSAKEVSLTSAFRSGYLEEVFLIAFCLLPLHLLKIDSHMIELCFIFFGLHGYFLHSNIRFKMPKPLRFIACPHFHHWHHERRLLKSGGQNYGATFTWWDMMIGKYVFPAETPSDYGLYGDEEIEGNFLGQFFYPLSNARIVKGKKEETL